LTCVLDARAIVLELPDNMESEVHMKKARPRPEGKLRAEYKRSDFAGPMARGKYAKRLRESSNIVVLKPQGGLS
jgi:hypothetical protein